MIKFAKIINEETKQCEVGLGINTEFYKSLGMTEQDVEQAYNGAWYLKGYVPTKPEPTVEEKLIELEEKYQMPRVLREIILANPNMYSAFIVGRARELEELAEIIRRKNNGQS